MLPLPVPGTDTGRQGVVPTQATASHAGSQLIVGCCPGASTCRALIGPSRGYCRRDGDGGGGWVITDMQRYSVRRALLILGAAGWFRWDVEEMLGEKLGV